MEHYVRFSTPSPLQSRSNSHDGRLLDGHSDEPPSPIQEEEHPRVSPFAWAAAWWQRQWWWQRPRRAAYQSNYMTLIPLSDSRLKPRHTWLIVSVLLLLALAAVTGVFIYVPRGVSIGTIDVRSTHMTFNATTLTYRIVLAATVPVFNPNYVAATIEGNVTVSFFDAEAGWSALGPVRVGRRRLGDAAEQLEVKVDASNLPRKYTQVVYTQCFNFPRKLIFFLLGEFHATYLGYTYQLPTVDTYFMLNCVDDDDNGVDSISEQTGWDDAGDSTQAAQFQAAPQLRPQRRRQQEQEDWQEGRHSWQLPELTQEEQQALLQMQAGGPRTAQLLQHQGEVHREGRQLTAAPG